MNQDVAIENRSKDFFAEGQGFNSNHSLLKKARSSKQLSPRSTVPKGACLSSSKVFFSELKIREYDRALGDNPECSCGPPLSLGWNFVDRSPVNLEEYEASKPLKSNLSCKRLNYYQRKNILIHVAGYTNEEIELATKQIQRVKFQRKVTKTFLSLHKVKEAAESARRKIHKLTSLAA